MLINARMVGVGSLHLSVHIRAVPTGSKIRVMRRWDNCQTSPISVAHTLSQDGTRLQVEHVTTSHMVALPFLFLLWTPYRRGSTLQRLWRMH